MAFVETVDNDPTLKRPEDDFIASLYHKKVQEFFPKDCEFKYFVGNLGDEEKLAEAERLKNKSFQCKGELKKEGDLTILWEKGTFDKFGVYCICLYYAIKPKKKETETKKECPTSETSSQTK